MGMFDYVEYEANCECCGEPLSGFQSKDGDCVLDTIQPSQVDNFYCQCNNCKTWHDFNVNRSCKADAEKAKYKVKSIEVSTKG